jgi:hypothetical protein
VVEDTALLFKRTAHNDDIYGELRKMSHSKKVKKLEDADIYLMRSF